MNRLELSDKISSMWRKSREDAGRSQEYMARALGVSKKTIQNWECGLSTPSLEKSLEWFDILELRPIPYYLELLYSDFEGLTPQSNDKDIENALISYIKSASSAEKRKLMFILYGQHGSSSAGILEMVVTHLQVPLQGRLNVAQNIITNYEIADATNSLVGNDYVRPNIEVLKQSYENAKVSVKNRKKSYSLSKGIDNVS